MAVTPRGLAMPALLAAVALFGTLALTAAEGGARLGSSLVGPDPYPRFRNRPSPRIGEHYTPRFRIGGDDKVPGGELVPRPLPDLILDIEAFQDTLHVEHVALEDLECALDEFCLAPEAFRIRKEEPDWEHHQRRLLRFTTSVYNNGTADFRPDAPRDQWTWHQCHRHYHSFKVFSVFEIFDYRGKLVADGQKASFCLEDTICYEGQQTFDCAEFGDQGVTVGCEDNYGYDLDCQWVDITELKQGHYSFTISVNFEYMVEESSFENNAIRCALDYYGEHVNVFDCRHEHPSVVERGLYVDPEEPTAGVAGIHSDVLTIALSALMFFFFRSTF